MSEMSEKRKEFNEVREEFAKWGGFAELLTDLKKYIAEEEKVGEKDIFDRLKKWMYTKEREFWDKSTPIATKLCNLNIEMAEIYIKGE